MSKGLISTLTYIYRFINLGRGFLTADELKIIRSNASIMVTKAPEIIGANTDDEQITSSTTLDLNQAAMIEQHIAESIEWQLRQEII